MIEVYSTEELDFQIETQIQEAIENSVLAHFITNQDYGSLTLEVPSEYTTHFNPSWLNSEGKVYGFAIMNSMN